MICTSVGEILIENGTVITKTPYVNMDSSFINYPLHYLGLTNTVKINNRKYSHEFPIIEGIMERAKNLEKQYKIENIDEKLRQCNKNIKEFRKEYRGVRIDLNEQLRNEYYNLVRIKKNLRTQREKVEKILFEQINNEFNIDISQELKCIKVRRIALCNTVENILNYLPDLRATYLAKASFPMFSYNLKKFTSLMKDKKSAIEGGPCIIGVDEVFFRIIYKSGQRRYFDIMTGFEDGPKNVYEPRRYNLANIIKTDQEDIVDIKIYEKHCSPTLHSAIELFRIMLIAKKLDLPLIIGLPDEGYRKYLSIIVNPLRIANQVEKEINNLLDRVVDEFLKLIDTINKIVDLEKFEVLHSRNTNLIKVFRQKTSEVAFSARKITDIQIKKEAIIDFSCLPAVPNFINGATNILEINNITELESLKATIKLFPEINFSALAFPFIPDIHNYSSMYHGKEADKIFIDEQYDTKLFSDQILNGLDDNIVNQVPWQSPFF